MIKFSAASSTGRKILGIGLSSRNIDLLMDDKPIFVDGQKLDFPTDLIILYGTTEEEIVEKMKEQGFDLPEPKPSPPGADNHDG